MLLCDNRDSLQTFSMFYALFPRTLVHSFSTPPIVLSCRRSVLLPLTLLLFLSTWYSFLPYSVLILCLLMLQNLFIYFFLITCGWDGRWGDRVGARCDTLCTMVKITLVSWAWELYFGLTAALSWQIKERKLLGSLGHFLNKPWCLDSGFCKHCRLKVKVKDIFNTEKVSFTTIYIHSFK